MYLWYKHA